MRKFLKLTLASQLVLVQLILIAAVLLAVSAVSVEQTRISFQRDQGRRILALAENLAASPVVRRAPVRAAGSTLPGAVAQLQATTGVEVVMVADAGGYVVASTDSLLMGDTITWPQLQAAPGRSSSATVELRGDSYLIAAAPILSNPAAAGNPVSQLGIALIARPNPSRIDSLITAGPSLLTYLGAAMVLGVIGSLLLARWIKRQTLGMEPAEIVALAEQREAIFAGIAEGVIALDTRDRVTMINPLAVRLLSLPRDTVGQSLAELGVEGRLRDVLTGSAGIEQDAVVIRSGRVLVLNRMPVRHAGRELGSVTTLRDRTQLAELESEIGAFRGTTDLLRAQTHEFANQLHTISGLIQIGDYEEVVSYVDSLTQGRAAIDLTVSRRVLDRSIAALLVAKSAVAAERKVALRVTDRTHLDPLEPQSAFDLATVLGNLIQNGIDASASSPPAEGHAPWVEVEIRQPGSTVEITVSDSGPGVDSTIATEVFEHGFTTKAARDGERGIGLALTKLICRRRGGEVEIRNTIDGAEFVARMTITPAEPREAATPVTPASATGAG
ncbi:MAG: two-component system, CitB family, sensor kinase [Propionibacteriaceae bacterium]|jgi:two-component system CitB family sensor kinase|nr:ATPase [Propionibacteriaceae bacterium]MDX6320493.1 two-component system, CitB family, sensor kinase [Propionibacteriaceae bacterium]